MTKVFTVIYSHDFPMGGEIMRIHCTSLIAEDTKHAIMRCLDGLGGFGSILLVFEGEHIPVLRGEIVHVWDDKVQYKTSEIPVPLIEES